MQVTSSLQMVMDFVVVVIVVVAAAVAVKTLKRN
jgi:hypothetical protein